MRANTAKENEMLKNGRVATRLPAQDLNQARAFYADKLGLHPVEERKGGLRYVTAAAQELRSPAVSRSGGTGR